jgi:hypothetical protein
VKGTPGNGASRATPFDAMATSGIAVIRKNECNALGVWTSEVLSMKAMKTLAALTIMLLYSSILSAQDQKPANVAAAPPGVALFAYQGVSVGKAANREKVESTLSRACDRLEAPKFWVDLESLTGDSEAIVFSPFDSYEQMEQTNADWTKFLAGHPDLGRMQEEIKNLVGSERKIVAVRRDDLGYLSEGIDFSEARFIHVLEVHVFPGHESDFAEAFKILADAYTKIQADTPWVVYQVDVGTPAPTFLVLRPMSELKQNDDLMASYGNLIDAEGEQGTETLKRIAREAYASTESNLYTVSPAMSHVSKSFAATDPEYWLHAVPDTKSEVKPDLKSGASRSK